MRQCRVVGEPYLLPATLLVGHSHRPGSGAVILTVIPPATTQPYWSALYGYRIRPELPGEVAGPVCSAGSGSGIGNGRGSWPPNADWCRPGGETDAWANRYYEPQFHATTWRSHQAGTQTLARLKRSAEQLDSQQSGV